MAPGQREGRGGRQRGVAAAATADVVVVIATVAVAGQHHVLKLLLDVVIYVSLHLDVARAIRDLERGGAQLESSRATAARVCWSVGWRRVHITT